MSRHIVIFEEGKHPRVVHGVDPATLDQSKILVNPVLPRGVPPHRWKKGKNCIEVLPEVQEVKHHEPPAVEHHRKPKLRQRLALAAAAVLIAIALKVLLS